jgi:glycosyltransferase involved in cell wall biosynthesis
VIPHVSVLVGSWNNSATIPRAIDSLLAQTLADLEVIVVDDGSTDATAACAAAYRDPRVSCLRLPHQGIARSLNAGLQAARAEFVAVNDADDWSLPERLERQVAALERDASLAVVGCLMREVDEDGRELRRRLPVARGDVRGALRRFNPIPNTAAAFRRSAVLEAGGYDPRWSWAMDYDLWLRLAERHALTNLPDELAVRELGTRNVNATREREQIAEAIAIRLAALRRRRTLRGATGLARPVLSFALPLGAKRALRRARGQAP